MTFILPAEDKEGLDLYCAWGQGGQIALGIELVIATIPHKIPSIISNPWSLEALTSVFRTKLSLE